MRELQMAEKGRGEPQGFPVDFMETSHTYMPGVESVPEIIKQLTGNKL